MKIPTKFKKTLSEECDFIVSKIKESNDPDEHLYYFSGTFTLLNRMLNTEFHSDLLFLHQVLQYVHQTMYGRLRAIQQGDRSYPYPALQHEVLVQLLIRMSDAIKKDGPLIEVLKDFVILAYSTTGNGNYLLQKGALKL